MILIIRWAGLQTNSSTWSFTLSQCKVSVSPAGWLFVANPAVMCVSSFHFVTFVTENESHMHAVSSSETNTPESAPQLPQATEEEEEVQYF